MVILKDTCKGKSKKGNDNNEEGIGYKGESI